MINKQIFNVSNLLSLSRIFLAIPMAYFMWHDEVAFAFLIIILAIITDFLDGYYARKLNQVTELGKILDPIGDKVIIGAAGVVLVLIGKMPLWFGLAILSRDLIILLGGLYIKNKIKFVIPSNWVGKITVNVLSIVLLLILFGVDHASTYGAYIATGFLLYSLIVYAKGMFTELQKVSK